MGQSEGARKGAEGAGGREGAGRRSGESARAREEAEVGDGPAAAGAVQSLEGELNALEHEGEALDDDEDGHEHVRAVDGRAPLPEEDAPADEDYAVEAAQEALQRYQALVARREVVALVVVDVVLVQEQL